MPLKTQRLLLRPAKQSDATDLWDVFRKPAVMRYWSEPPHASLARTAELVAGMVALGSEPAYFTVEHQGRAIGTAGFWQGDEIGFILHPDFWGQGLGRELTVAVVGFGFTELGFDMIRADVDPGNVASLRLLHSAGFRETGRATRTMQVGDQWVDSVYLQMDSPGQTAK